ncbi:hypothetical protein M5K25_005832 [Dendrobium thyrsiflorum]|uniref:Uncharacterized protein n=1 Tax=Dendrobium thyrsiflorum TaxID=117978 RepID=A0ABD0VQ71_DENTH
MDESGWEARSSGQGLAFIGGTFPSAFDEVFSGRDDDWKVVPWRIGGVTSGKARVLSRQSNISIFKTSIFGFFGIQNIQACATIRSS